MTATESHLIGWTLIAVAVLVVAAAVLAIIVSHLSQEAAAADWERHVATIPLSPEMEARLQHTWPPLDPETPIYSAVKRQQEVRFMAEAVEELRGLGVDLTEGDAS